MSQPFTFADLMGHDRLTWASPPVYGQPIPAMIYERYDGAGVLVERRICPPVVRIIYDEPRRWWMPA